MPNVNNDIVTEFNGIRRALMHANHSHAQAGTLHRTISDLDRYLKRPMRIVVLGEHNSGKTALINSIMGRQVLPTAVIANTPVSVTMRFGQQTEIRTQSSCGNWFDIDPSRPLINFDGSSLRAVEVKTQNPLLKKFEFVDTPPASNPKSYVAGADIVIWCTNATRAWSQSERRTWMALPQRCRRNGILVATHMDTLNSKTDREKVMRRLSTEAIDAFEEILLLTSAPATDAPGTQLDHDISGVSSLLQSLQLMSHDQRARRARAADRIADRLTRSIGPSIRPPKLPPMEIGAVLAS